MVGERVQFDEETWQALDMLARDRTMSFQVIADEAFIDLLPVDLKDALKRSVKERPHAGEDKPAQRTARGRQR
jgi:hypothetical protein